MDKRCLGGPSWRQAGLRTSWHSPQNVRVPLGHDCCMHQNQLHCGDLLCHRSASAVQTCEKDGGNHTIDQCLCFSCSTSVICWPGSPNQTSQRTGNDLLLVGNAV